MLLRDNGHAQISCQAHQHLHNRCGRSVFGDHLLSGPNNSYIATLVERHTRYVMLAKVAGKDTRTVVSALIKQAKKLPKELYESLTWDRGKELTDHRRFTLATKIRKARGSAGRTRTPMAC
jgi:IS30 family transposase